MGWEDAPLATDTASPAPAPTPAWMQAPVVSEQTKPTAVLNAGREEKSLGRKALETLETGIRANPIFAMTPRLLTNGEPAGPPRAAEGAIESIEAGFQGSVRGLQWRGKLPELVIDPENSKWWERALGTTSQVVNELPEMVAGWIGGAAAGGAVGAPLGPGGVAAGGFVGGNAGANAVPAMMRQTLIEAYRDGDIDTVGEFFDAFKNVLQQTATEGGIGALVGKAGWIAGRTTGKVIAPAIGKSISVPAAQGTIVASDIAAQISTMTMVPAALRGELPDAQDWLDAGIVVGGMATAGKVGSKMMDTWARTGKKPAEIVADAQTDPSIKADLVRDEAPIGFETPVGETIQRNLEAVGMPEAEAGANAKLWDSYFNTMAERTGLAPDVLLDRYFGGITKGDVAGAESLTQAKETWATLEQTLAGDNLGAARGVIDKLKSGDMNQANAIQYLQQLATREGVTPEARQAMLDAAKLVPQAKSIDQLFQPAYHGSPHDFDKFSLDKIGTGEGAQAYGHGLYFAENPEVAKGYQEMLATKATTVDGVRLKPGDPKFAAAMHIAASGYDKALAQAKEGLQFTTPLGKKGLEQEIADIESLKDAKIDQKSEGAIYQVDIPDQHVANFLDWDKPLSEQPASVRKVLPAIVEKYGDHFFPPVDKILADPKWTGEGLYKSLAVANRKEDAGYFKGAGENGAASEYLNSLGIKGIKYLDAGSRTGDKETRNLVVFDDSIVKITHKDGTPVTAKERQQLFQGDIPQTETEAFRKWFGDSKVVDAEGKPLVVYHGTNADFDTFATGKQSLQVGEGFHFGTSKQANMRVSGAGKNLMPVYLSATDLQRSKDLGGKWKSKIQAAKASGKDGIVYLNRYEGITLDTIQRAEREGVNLDKLTDDQFRRYVPEATDSYIVFRPEQIKSAIGNRGTFDPNDPSILMQSRQPTDRPIWADEFEDAGGEIAPDGTMLLWHATTKANATNILKTGRMLRPSDAPDSYGVYFSSSKDVANDYGDGTLVPVRVRSTDVKPDDVFPGRQRMDFSAPTKSGKFIPLAVGDAALNWKTDKLLQDGKARAARGYTEFGPDKRMTIGLLQSADRSTFLHESGHVFLEITNDLAHGKEGTPQLKADMQAVFDWVGVKGWNEWNAMTLDQKRPYHEQFARGFESYLREGKAPSAGLAKVFGIMRDWLVQIYRSASQLRVNVSPEVKNVMARMLATDQEIAAGVPRAYAQEAVTARAELMVPTPTGKAREIAASPFAEAIPQAKGEPTLPTHVNYYTINSVEDLHLAKARVSEIYEAEIQTQRRGKVSVEQTTAEAAQIIKDNLSGQDISLIMPREPGTAAGSAEILARKYLMLGSAEDTARLRDALLEKGTDASEKDKIEYLASIERSAMIQAEFLGARAEIGRAMNILKNTAQDAEVARLTLQVIDQYGGDPVKLAKMMKEIDTPAGILKMNRELAKASTWDKIVEGWKAGLLSGPITHMRNIIGNSSGLLTRPLVDAASIPFGILRGSEAERVRAVEPLARVIGQVQAIHDASKLAVASFSLADAAKAEQPRQAITGPLAIPVQAVFRSLGAADVFFRTLYERGEAYALGASQAAKEGLNPSSDAFKNRMLELVQNPTKEMQEAITESGDRGTFNKPFEPGGGGRAATNLVRKMHMEFLFPFIRTPVRVLEETFRLSPFAPMIPSWRADFKAGGVRRDRAMGELVTGGAMMGGFFVASLNGIITGSGDPDPRKREIAQAAGFQAYSFKFGDTYYNYQGLGPLATLIGMAADMAQVWDHMSDEERDKIPKIVAVAFANAVTNQTALMGMTNLVNITSDPTRYAPKFFDSFAGSLVPALIAQPTAIYDDYARQVNGMLEQIKSRIPGLRQTLMPKVDVFGKEIESKDRVLLASPITKTTESKDPVRTEAARLNVSAPGLPKKLHLGRGSGKLGDIEITPEQRDAYRRASGEMVDNMMRGMVESPSWAQMPDIVKRKAYQKAFAIGARVGAMAALPPDIREGAINEITQKMEQQFSIVTPTSSELETVGM